MLLANHFQAMRAQYGKSSQHMPIGAVSSHHQSLPGGHRLCDVNIERLIPLIIRGRALAGYKSEKMLPVASRRASPTSTATP